MTGVADSLDWRTAVVEAESWTPVVVRGKVA